MTDSIINRAKELPKPSDVAESGTSNICEKSNSTVPKSKEEYKTVASSSSSLSLFYGPPQPRTIIRTSYSCFSYIDKFGESTSCVCTVDSADSLTIPRSSIALSKVKCHLSPEERFWIQLPKGRPLVSALKYCVTTRVLSSVDVEFVIGCKGSPLLLSNVKIPQLVIEASVYDALSSSDSLPESFSSSSSSSRYSV